jgi:hypothetical protein
MPEVLTVSGKGDRHMVLVEGTDMMTWRASKAEQCVGVGWGIGCPGRRS